MLKKFPGNLGMLHKIISSSHAKFEATSAQETQVEKAGSKERPCKIFWEPIVYSYILRVLLKVFQSVDSTFI